MPIHLVQRGVVRQACFFDGADRRACLDDLAKIAADVGCAIHACVLMTNHVHLLLTPTSAEGPARLMNRLGRRHVRRINDLHRRTGTLWEGRFRSCVTDSDAYVLACHRYIELNPVRAGIVPDPRDYPWSSHRGNLGGAPAGILTPQASYLALGPDRESRGVAYAALFEGGRATETVDQIRRATATNAPFATPRSQAQIEAMLGWRVAPLPKGRPRKTREA
jgi:putative transposase